MEMANDRPFTIRAIRAEDHGAWLPLWDGYNAFYGREGATALDPTITARTFAWFLDSSVPVYALVAEQRDRLVGLAHYLYHHTTTGKTLNCYLQDLFTAPDARGQGIARALIETVYERARQADAGRVYWHTRQSNVTARRLYDGLAEHEGFIVYTKRF